MRRKAAAIGIGVAVLAAVGVLATLGRPEPQVSGPPPRPAAEVAAAPVAPPSVDGWIPWTQGDFKEQRAEVRDGRIRLRCSTLGTDDRTVKFLGMTSTATTSLERGARVTATLDWNAQSNGSYLTGALVLAAPGQGGNPLAARDWLKVEYVGVPPGKNGRVVVAVRTAGRDRVLFQEGWPEKNREGRPISRQAIEVVLKPGGAFDVLENGALLYACAEPLAALPAAQVSVLMTSHSNYPPRELFWESVAVAQK